MKKNVTIQDVAKLAGVSKTTISHYLNGKFGNMSLETKEKIEKVIVDLDYKPNKQAQGLKNKKSFTVGFLIADIENLYSAFLIKAIQLALDNTDYQLIMMNSDNSVTKERQAIEKMINQNIDGLLLQPVTKEIENYQLIVENQLPTVLVDRGLEKNIFSTIQSDNKESIKKLVEIIAKRKYQKIIVVSEDMNSHLSRMERVSSVKNSVSSQEEITELDFIELKHLGKGLDISYYLKENPISKKTCFFALNGTALSEIVRGLTKNELFFPKDVGVCGYDDWLGADLIYPGITSIQQHPDKIGERAVEVLLKEMSKKTIPCSITIETTLKKRNSLK